MILPAWFEAARQRWLDASFWKREYLRLRASNAELNERCRSLEQASTEFQQAKAALDNRIDELIHQLGPSNQRVPVLTYQLHELNEHTKILKIREPALRSSLEDCQKLNKELRGKVEELTVRLERWAD